jgi:DNA-binding response OmpR family regulator
VSRDDRLRLLEEENDFLREQIARLERVLVGEQSMPVEWRLTQQEQRVMGVLVNREFASKDAIMAALYRNLGRDEAEPKIVDVFVCKIRKKLKPFGIDIRTVWGTGYCLPPEQRTLLRQQTSGVAE